jgi:hypothetical protein
MSQRTRTLSAAPLFAAVAMLALSACTTTPAGAPLSEGQEATIEGTVVSVDTGPWAYDGNAVVTVATGAGNVSVQLPARWNLCKAPPPGDVQALKPSDRVQAVGTVTAPGQIVVCAQPQHRLSKVQKGT